MNSLNTTDIDRNFSEIKDDPDFRKHFWLDILLCEAIALGFTYGFVVAVLNADRIDSWFYDIFKSIWF